MACLVGTTIVYAIAKKIQIKLYSYYLPPTILIYPDTLIIVAFFILRIVCRSLRQL